MSYVWEQRKLSKYATFLSGNGLRWDDIDDTGVQECILYGNLYTDYGMMTDTIKYRTNSIPQNPVYSKEGDVLIPASDTTPTGLARATSLEKSGVLLGGDINIVRPNKDINGSCLSLALNANKDQMIRLIKGTTVRHIHNSDIQNIDITLPNYKIEQFKIASYFKVIDNIITLHQRKILLYKYFFTIVWEQRKLSEIATMHARIGWQNLRTSEFLENGDYMLITGTDFVDGSINYSTCYFVNKERYEQDKNIQIKNGSILITKDGTLGKVALVQGLSMPATLNAGIFNIEIKKELEIDNKYLFQYLKAPFLLDYVKKRATGGTIKHLNQNILVNFPVLTPQKLEQTKIGQYFSNLDNLITLHRCKCIIYRKNMVNAWEQRKLGDIADIVGGGTPSTSNSSYWDGDIDWYAPAEIAEQIYANSSQRKITDLGYENSSAKMLPPGTILFTSRAGIGKTAILTRKGCTNQGFQSIVPHSGELDSYFIFSRTEELKRYGELVGAGSTFVEVSGKQMAAMEIMMPSTMQEQQVIGHFFRNLDNLITLHQWKCIVCTKIKVNTWIQCKFIKIGVKLQKCILLSIILLFKRRKVSCVFYVNILLRFIKVIELEVELVFVIIDGTIIVMFYLKIRCLYLNIFIFKINK